MSAGKVFLVGAGPGDPGLITKRGYELLHSADAVVVDALVNPALLRGLRADIILAGKRGPGALDGFHRSFPQEMINRLLVKLGKQGKRVVRLKGGDPFVFARGGDELDALIKAKVRFEVVPGVSSTTAAPAYAGIPVTDRRWASQVTFVTGHETENQKKSGPGVDWKRLSPQGTLVVVMGVSSWLQIQRRLLMFGWPPSKPVAAIQSASTRTQRALISTLGNSVRDFRVKKLNAPAVIVVGNVVRRHKNFQWLRREKPLFGKRVVVTRPREQSEELTRLLEEAGADVLLCPTVCVEWLERTPAIRRAVERLNEGDYHGVIFLSANAVRALSRSAVSKTIAAYVVGPATRRTATELGWRVEKMPPEFNGRSLAKTLSRGRSKRLLLPRVENAPEGIVRALAKNGWIVDEVPFYRTVAVPIDARVKPEVLAGVDALTFTSASTARGFYSGLKMSERHLLRDTLVVSIGPQTTAELRSWGVRNLRQAKQATIPSLYEVLQKNI